MLSDLEARWQQEKTPQAGLRLAESLHRQGDRARAEEMLDRVEEQLAGAPRDLASRVALGGLRLALNQPAAAARMLEQVVERDATHLKANKLLVEVYLELGERPRARDRLDLYRLLNEGDPEIEALEGLLIGEPVPRPPAAATGGGRQLVLAAGDPFTALTAAVPATAAGGSLLELAPPPAAAPPAATATLAGLYRDQGHAEEAARIFRDVLEDDPGNIRARAGLKELAGPPAAAAAPVLGARELDGDRQRRIAVLRDYLARLQRARRAGAG